MDEIGDSLLSKLKSKNTQDTPIDKHTLLLQHLLEPVSENSHLLDEKERELALETLLPVLCNPKKKTVEMTVIPALVATEALLDRADDYPLALETIRTEGVKEAVEDI